MCDGGATPAANVYVFVDWATVYVSPSELPVEFGAIARTLIVALEIGTVLGVSV